MGGQQEPGARLPSQPDVLADMPVLYASACNPHVGHRPAAQAADVNIHTPPTVTHIQHGHSLYTANTVLFTHTRAQALRRQELSLEPTENVVDVLLTFNHLTNTQLHVIVVLLEAFQITLYIIGKKLPSGLKK